jgi:hypothetical protein
MSGVWEEVKRREGAEGGWIVEEEEVAAGVTEA